MKRLNCVLVLLFSTLFTPVHGQSITFDGCVDYFGRPVASVPNDYLNDVARARLAPDGLPLIE